MSRNSTVQMKVALAASDAALATCGLTAGGFCVLRIIRMRQFQASLHLGLRHAQVSRRFDGFIEFGSKLAALADGGGLGPRSAASSSMIWPYR